MGGGNSSSACLLLTWRYTRKGGKRKENINFFGLLAPCRNSSIHPSPHAFPVETFHERKKRKKGERREGGGLVFLPAGLLRKFISELSLLPGPRSRVGREKKKKGGEDMVHVSAGPSSLWVRGLLTRIFFKGRSTT